MRLGTAEAVAQIIYGDVISWLFLQGGKMAMLELSLSCQGSKQDLQRSTGGNLE